MRGKQHKLETVLDNRELIKELESTYRYTITCKNLDLDIENSRIGVLLSYLQDLDCIDIYEENTPTRYLTESFDPESLEELREIFAPDKTSFKAKSAS